MFAVLAEILAGLWWVAVTCTLAAVLAMRAAWLGVIPKTIGALGASALMLMAVTYWLDLFTSTPAGVLADMRRGAGLIMWPSIAWTMAALITESNRLHR